MGTALDFHALREEWERVLLLSRRRIGPETGRYYAETAARVIIRLVGELERAQIVVDEAAACAFGDVEDEPWDAPASHKLVVQNLQNAFERARKVTEE